MNFMSCCFSDLEKNDLLDRELSLPIVRPSLHDLDGSIVFGTGVLARQVLSALSHAKLKPAWIVDSNPALWGTFLDGVKIYPPSSLKKADGRLVLIASSFLRPMAEICREAGVLHWAWFFDIHEIFGSLRFLMPTHDILKESEIDRLYSLLVDSPVSQNVLKKSLIFRITGDPQDLPERIGDQYFVEGLVPLEFYLRFVDCGAFTGDTLLDWVSRMTALDQQRLYYYGFEPDPANFAMLENHIHKFPNDFFEQFSIYPFAVGAASGEMRIAQGNSGTVLSDFANGPEVPVIRLDEILRGETVGAIKMDLEGFEPFALEGSRGILETQRPALLVAIYHRPDHLWKIPLWIHDLGLGYKLHLRHHASSFAETICYAVPE